MTANEIRSNGITAPGNAYSGGSADGSADPAVAENLGMIAGILLELAAQGAERNELLRETNAMQREALTLSYEHSAWQAKLVNQIATKPE